MIKVRRGENIIGVGVINYMPSLEINYSQDAQERSLEFSLPLFIHKLIRPNQVALDAYENFYREYTISNSNVIFKLDEFVNNPAPPNVPMPAVLKKFGDLLTGIFKLNVNVFPNPSEFKKIWATGQYFYKPETEQKPVLLPVLVELEWYEANTRQLRMSLRCGGSPYINYAIFQMVQLYTAGVPSSPATNH